MTDDEIIDMWKRINATTANRNSLIQPDADGYLLEAWREDLGAYRADQVRQAYATYRRSGNPFPPTAGQLAKLCDLGAHPLPTFGEVKVLLERAISAHGRYHLADAQAMLSQHRGVWEWVTACGGWDAVCNGGPDPDDPIDPGVWLAEQEHRWREVSAAIESGRPLPALSDTHRSPQLPGQPEGMQSVGALLGAPK